MVFGGKSTRWSEELEELVWANSRIITVFIRPLSSRVVLGVCLPWGTIIWRSFEDRSWKSWINTRGNWILFASLQQHFLSLQQQYFSSSRLMWIQLLNEWKSDRRFAVIERRIMPSIQTVSVPGNTTGLGGWLGQSLRVFRGTRGQLSPPPL